jgi:DNA topoisomerase-3
MKLVICEKKSQVESFIAAKIGWEMKSGYAVMMRDGEEWRAVWSKGHLLTLMTPDEVVIGLSWQSTDQLVPIPMDYRKKINKDENMPQHAKSEAYLDRIGFHLKKADEVIIGTDSDREGEHVGWSIIDHLGWDGPVRRLWLAAGLDPKSIKQAFDTIRGPERTKSWARAAEARGRSDWAFMFAVRAYTYYSKYGKFGKALGEGRGQAGTTSVGRVQTPTLGMVVRREEEIENFVSIPHFKISGIFSPANQDNATIEANYDARVTQEIIDSEPLGVHWEPSKEPPNDKGEVPLDKPLFIGKKEVASFTERLKEASEKATVLSYKDSSSATHPKKTYSLGDAQTDIGRALKIKSGSVQTILEDLYEQGYTSYARTSKAELPINYHDPENRRDMLSAISGISELSEAANTASQIHDGKHEKYKPFLPKVFVKVEMEHHGIIPTSKAMSDEKLKLMQPKKKNDKTQKVAHTSAMMQQAYLMVCKRYISAILPPATFSTQSVVFSIPVLDLLGTKDSRFKANAKRLSDPGFSAFFDQKLTSSSDLPAMTNGDAAKLHKAIKKESMTKPPSRYTSTSLQAAMESIAKEIRDPRLRALLKLENGIGTPATRSKIVETLEARNYIVLQGDNYIPTERGRAVIKAVPDWMSSPETSAVWEDYLAQICEITDDTEALRMRDNFVEKQTKLIEKLIKEMKEKYDGDLGERIDGGSVSPKMKKAIETISQRKGIKEDPEILKDFNKAKAFLDEHLGENAAPMPPSEKQIGLARKIMGQCGGVTEDELKVSSKRCSEYIDQNIDKYRASAKPSIKQKKYAEKLADELPDDKKPAPSIFENAAACSAFIDEQMKGKAKKGGGKKTSAGSKPGRGGRGGAPERKRATKTK